jgi:hypothetical protein
LSGLSLPLTLAAGQSTSFTVTFSPSAGGNANGSVSLVSDAPSSPSAVPLSGNGLAPGSYTLSGTITPAADGAGTTLTLSGAASATTTANSSGAYSFTGLANGSYTVTPSKSGYQFSPPSTTVTISGANRTGVNFTASVVTSFVVDLTWDPSPSGTVVGYNVYRGDLSGGPYTKLNTFPVGLTYRDDTVALGRTYYYVATATTAGGTESVYSNEAAAVIPSS